jgi:hypothetical protein
MDDEDLASKGRTSRALAFGLEPVVRQSASRSEDAFCRSRQILKPTCADIGPDLFRDAVQTAVLSEVAVNLPIPCRLIPLANKSDQFREFFRRKSIDGILEFCKAHGESLSFTIGDDKAWR